MYDFLAPWGVLAPAFCAALSYFVIAEQRRARMIALIQAPTQSS